MKIFNNISLFIFCFYKLIFEKCFFFSIVIPIYNSGRYLDDSICSIINQTLGVKNIQLILINDGSIDDSENLSLKYQNLLKKNLIYIKIKHSGVSKARNIGMKYAKGIYINFLDSDDKWDYKAFRHIFLFFNLYKNIDYVVGRIIFFEFTNKNHILDYKFYKSRIINLTQDYNFIQLQVSSSVFKRDILKGKFFNEEISYSEDTRFINSILLVNPLMGVLKEAIYYYRRRQDFSSLIQNKENNLNFYFKTINSVFYYILNTSLVLYNKVVPFIQFLIGYEFLFRILSPADVILGSDNYRKYIFLIDEILKQIEDKYILEQNILLAKYRIFMLCKKYHKDIRFELKLINDSIFYLNHEVINLRKDKKIIFLTQLNIKNNKIYIEAVDNFFMHKDKYFYFCMLDKKKFFPTYTKNSNYDFFTLYGFVEKGRIITFEIPLELSNTTKVIYFYLTFLENNIEIFPSLGMFTHIPYINHGYYITDNYILKYYKKRLHIFQYNVQLAKKFEQLYCNSLKKANKKFIIDIRRKHIKYRNEIKKKNIFEVWLINDEIDRAGDSGEYFFRFLKSKKPKGIKPYFVILKNCPDYKRLKKLGGILDINSPRYKNTFLESNKIFSTVYDPWIYNPFQNEQKYLRDLFNFTIILINYNILIDDLSKLINKSDRNIYFIVTSSNKENKAILSSNLRCNRNNIILTGMPKYDNLEKLKKLIKNEKIILIMPNILKNSFKSIKQRFFYEEKFLSNLTRCFEFYNKLINDKLLLLYMNDYNYTGIFCFPHFIDSKYFHFFQNKKFSVIKNCDSEKLIVKSSLLITDYLDLFFDFAYLRKPVIYNNFIIKNYRNIPNRESNFDCKKFGFGSICSNIQCIIKEIIFELKNKCKLRKKYFHKIEKYFAYFDENNSQRLFEKISEGKQNIVGKENNLIFIFFSLIILIMVKVINFLIF